MKISKEKINQAGRRLINKESQLSVQEANSILQEFRLIHQHPMSLFRHIIGRKLKKYSIDAAPVQRLKRIPSIVKKLKIQKNMNLSRMQDIGGLRIVLENMEEVNLVRNEIKKVEKHGNFKFTFANEKNYIKNPPDSGYRSIHMVYKYEKDVLPEEKCRVEIQIRTQLQHSWATAVEVLGTCLSQPLKQSVGSQEYLDIFKKISKIFTGLENRDINSALIKEVEKSVETVKLLEKLENFNMIAKHLDDNAQGQYALLKMDFQQEIVEIAQYGKARFEQANKDYLKMELENFKNEPIEIVLISIQDIKKLQTSYPNYFMDTTEFIENLHKLFVSTKEMQRLEKMIDNSQQQKERIGLEEMLNNIIKNTLSLFDGSKK